MTVRPRFSRSLTARAASLAAIAALGGIALAGCASDADDAAAPSSAAAPATTSSAATTTDPATTDAASEAPADDNGDGDVASVAFTSGATFGIGLDGANDGALTEDQLEDAIERSFAGQGVDLDIEVDCDRGIIVGSDTTTAQCEVEDETAGSDQEAHWDVTATPLDPADTSFVQLEVAVR